MTGFYLSNLWRWKCGIPEVEEVKSDINTLIKTEWSVDFEILMRNRLVVGAYRYGRMGKMGKPKYDRVSDMIRRLKEFQIDGNKEHLVDVANLSMMEFVETTHPLAHFKPLDGSKHTPCL